MKIVIKNVIMIQEEQKQSSDVSDILKKDAYSQLDLFKFEIRELARLGKNIHNDYAKAVVTINDYLYQQGHLFDQITGEWWRSETVANCVFVQMANPFIVENMDLEPVRLHSEAMEFVMFNEEYESVSRIDCLEEYLIEEFAFVDRDQLDVGYIYDHFVDNDIYFYEVSRDFDSKSVLFEMCK